ncbi:hypothetical protein [Corynebacterium matruchotii]|uniref:hypothetical protein n=1 Tax=Corynebacterium matruchotii TaxID=43768 RepID=UPI0028EDD6FB|nr:hypothetical protein [Corynebacterium matruchotii]
MKNALFTGIAGENPAVLLSREQTPGIGMSLFSKDGGEKYHCRTLRRPSLLQVYYFK